MKHVKTALIFAGALVLGMSSAAFTMTPRPEEQSECPGAPRKNQENRQECSCSQFEVGKLQLQLTLAMREAEAAAAQRARNNASNQ